ncbi:IS110 family transposase [Collinsella sp. An2]|uniref:IS110 family transposase n=1 Tax=Collinsella sp. An2 TaxID=1965585 RepID=UPI000B39B47B|nr:IS110 family transposase [Collinsella sp. An2]OUP11053.1 IS110 family transposase [Collinsella sp. An2]
MSQYVTSIGLDVHARSISAFAFNPMTGECESARFGYDPVSVAEWALGFEEPKAVYESGVTGFHLCRALRALGVDCVVGAVSKMQRPAADRRRKTDRRDAEFLARLLATRNVTEVWVPDERTEAARDLSRALADARDDLRRAKQRMGKFLLRHGHVFDERTPAGRRRGNWTAAYCRWVGSISFAEADDACVLEYYRDCVRRAEEAWRDLARRVAEAAGRPEWKPVCDALRCLKGVESATAFCLAAEAGDFGRFPTAPSFASWCGLTPSERSSGETVSRGGITRAGNAHARAALVEAAWHVPMSGRAPKALASGQSVAPAVRRHATKGNRRLQDRREAMRLSGKRPCVANCATAREMACWAWALARMAG